MLHCPVSCRCSSNQRQRLSRSAAAVAAISLTQVLVVQLVPEISLLLITRHINASTNALLVMHPTQTRTVMVTPCSRAVVVPSAEVADCSKIAETVAAASSGNSTASNGTSYSNAELLRSAELLLDLETQLQLPSKLAGSEEPYADHVLNQCVATCSSGHAPNSNNDCEGNLFV